MLNSSSNIVSMQCKHILKKDWISKFQEGVGCEHNNIINCLKYNPSFYQLYIQHIGYLKLPNILVVHLCNKTHKGHVISTYLLKIEPKYLLLKYVFCIYYSNILTSLSFFICSPLWYFLKFQEEKYFHVWFSICKV